MNQSAIQDLLNELGKQVTGDLRQDAYSRTLYSTDASIYQVKPYGVLLPETLEDVHAAVEFAAKHRVPILPRAGGSSLAGQAVNEALVIDMTRHLDRTLEINTEEQWVRVQPGLVLDQLNLDLQPYGYQFGPDPASSNRAAMGGIVANNSTGSHSIVYGMTADHVLEMDVILSDGTRTHFAPLSEEGLIQAKKKDGLEGDLYRQLHALTYANGGIIQEGTPRHWRRCGGYNLDRLLDNSPEKVSFKYPHDTRFNLSKLVCGSEGTLAVMTEIKLNIVPIPQKRALAIVHFDDLFTALSAVPLILEVDPTAVELLDHLGLTTCREVPKYARLLDTFVEGHPDCVLITEFYGESDAELQHKIDRLKEHIQTQNTGAGTVIDLIDPAQQQNVWTVRKVALGFLMGIKGDHKPIPFIEDAAVPVEHLAEYVTKIERYCNDLGTRVAYYAHASAGCVHIRPLVNSKDAAEIAKLPDIVNFSVDLLRGYGGSLSSEHGDGRARSHANERFFGPELYGLYQKTKQLCDPENILNPGNVVNPPPMKANLRYGESYAVIPIDTVLDFSADEGFHRAIEMCNGAGVCRKRTTGVMCPSFIATREEEHSTRGRANALRAALSGRLPASEFTSKRMYEVMDLCISCKACKSECPSSVDMGKIKVEYLAQYYKANGTPFRARLFGNIAALSRLSSGWRAPLANWGLRQPLVRNIMESVTGISAQREMPPFASEPFLEWFKKHPGKKADRQVVLFNDTFSTYNHPEIAQAAVEVFEAMGYEVLLPGHNCCGRPMISKGLVNGAKKLARDTIAKLAPYAKRGLAIVGLEPSCFLSIHDEYSYLIPDAPDLALVQQQTRSFEEFIQEHVAKGELQNVFTDEKRHILLHGHCHQKALIGTDPVKAMLGLPPNYSVEEIDTSCCGMAGSFGYEKEHYDISMTMSERRLAPTIREADAQTLIVAAGTSCRDQIRHTTGKAPLHPVQVIRDALKEKAAIR